jgi:hypothetical protein
LLRNLNGAAVRAGLLESRLFDLLLPSLNSSPEALAGRETVDGAYSTCQAWEVPQKTLKEDEKLSIALRCWGSITGPLARLQRGRAERLMGDNASTPRILGRIPSEFERCRPQQSHRSTGPNRVRPVQKNLIVKRDERHLRVNSIAAVMKVRVPPTNRRTADARQTATSHPSSGKYRDTGAMRPSNVASRLRA